MKDPYEVLGVQKTDSESAIRTAYRKLAKRHHPDLNPGKPEAADRFKEISVAYDILSDADKRAPLRPRRDRRRRQRGAAAAAVLPDDTAGREKYHADIDPEDLDSIFAHAFGGGGGDGFFRAGGGRGRQFRARGADAHYTLTVSFLDAANGSTRRITLPEGRTLDVRIPAGVHDGHILRLKGQGMPGLGGGPAGDALVEIAVAPHPLFRREGDDIIVELPVTMQEAILGASLEVPTIKGKVRLNIPPNSGSGTRLRLRGRGIHQGHQFVQLHVVLPPTEEPELAEFMKTWEPRHPFNPRAGLEDV